MKITKVKVEVVLTRNPDAKPFWRCGKKCMPGKNVFEFNVFRGDASALSMAYKDREPFPDDSPAVLKEKAEKKAKFDELNAALASGVVLERNFQMLMEEPMLSCRILDAKEAEFQVKIPDAVTKKVSALDSFGK